MISNTQTMSSLNKINKSNETEEMNEIFDVNREPYIETPWNIIESYFRGQHLERFVRHQLESYNNFVGYQIIKTIEMFNPVHIASEQDFDPVSKKYSLEIFITFENFHIYRPQIHENNGAIKLMFPQEARLRNFTYASATTIDINIKYVVRSGANLDNVQTFYKTIPKIHIGKLPIMLKSNICVLNQYKHFENTQTGECKFDAGGYFIINGSEKTVLGQERAAENRVYCFNVSKNDTKYTWKAEIKSVPDFKCISPKQINMMISSKNNGFGNAICVELPRVKQPIPLFIVFRALGLISDKEICEKILLDINNEKNKPMLEALQASIIEANKHISKEECIKYITGFVMYTPINMDKETGAKKKHEFTMEILNNDLFPHCHNIEQKIYFLGYMTHRLLLASFEIIKQDDRDSYLNKRVDLTGTLLNNLYRNYFNKLVKDMEKQIIREINTGSWKSTDDYENIINLTNIYKIIKSTTIENGLKRALSTGDFGIKHTNSNKVGVAQVLNRLNYVSSLSHARRISTPTDKSGKLIPPRKLHNTSWGFLCPAETPEGQSVGVVKNLSYMTHITIYSNSLPLYEYVMPNITQIDSEELTSVNMYDQVKVFINGAWVGITDKPHELYLMLKDKKYKGIINIYTSIVFDYKLKEIRVCNDSGRLTRPVLRVKNKNILLNNSLVKKLNNFELIWDDLLTSSKIEDSVLEYIDPEEQGWSLIATKPKDIIETSDNIYKYTHCEIHPSTIFGVLASCIPFPEHNQSPRNTYQCLDINETVLLSNGSKIPIKDVKIGDKVLCFNPETLETSYTCVINHYVRETDKYLYKIQTLSGREIIATQDHKFMTTEGWKEVQEFNENDTYIGIMPLQNSLTHNSEMNSIILDETIFRNKFIEFGLELTYINRQIEQLTKLNLLPLSSNDYRMPILARIFGFLLADGSINIYERNTKYIACSFDFGTENDVKMFENDIEQCGFNKCKYYNGTRTFNNITHSTFAVTHNGSLPSLLIALEITYGRKTETKRNPLPEWIMNGSLLIKREFLSGFQGGDGCKIRWNKNNTGYNFVCGETSQQINPEYTDSLLHFMNQCVELLIELNIEVHIQNVVNINENRNKVAYKILDKQDNLIKYYDNIGYRYAFTKNTGSFIVIEYLRYKNLCFNKHKLFIENVRNLCDQGKSNTTIANELNSRVSYISDIRRSYMNNRKISMKNIGSDTIEKWLKTIKVINGMIFMPTISIVQIENRLVSDITVESENHSFIAGNNFLSSNCAQGKQAMGVYVTNYENRMDKTAYVLNYPMRPLVDTRIMNMIQLNKIPSGTQVIVAIMTHTGYNQEDSLLINKGSIDRGMALVTVYHTEKDEDKQKINGDEEIRCKPDSTKTKGMKMGNYNKVNSKGVIPENVLVENRDIIIAKVTPIKENRNDHTKVIKYEDQSKIYKTVEETYIDKNYIDRNGEGYNFAKVRLRTVRKPVIGDKFCMTSDHDVLTLNRGWVPINEVKNTDLVGQLNRTTNTLEYVNPLEILEFDHKGKMYEVVTQGISQYVTLNHRMWIKKRDKKTYELIPAEKIIGKRVQFQSGSSPIDNSELEVKIDNITYTGSQCDAFLTLFGIFIAEGWTYINEKEYICRIEIAANKLRVQEQLKKSCELLNLNYSMNEKTFKWYINNKVLTNEFKKYSVGAVNKYLPDWYTMLSERQAKILLNGLCLGDGHETATSLHYFTSSIKLRDNIQILAQHAGYTAYYVARSEPGDYSVMTDGRKITATTTAWDIGIRRKRLFPTLNHGHKNEQNGQTEKIFDYEGKVFCLRVPSEVFLVRRHGRCSFTGNSSRHGQKGTVGNIIPECDMPFTSNGVKPDIIINPHAIPSRMTIGQLKETVLGKVLLELGLFGDGTSFGDFELKDICSELIKLGYEAHGNELLYNGLTGEQHECSVFMGPVFYQRLKHMVNDKAHSRSIGPMVNLTRQPAEGRSRDGGLRFGEMERDCMWYRAPILLNCGLSIEIGTMEKCNYNVLGFNEKMNQLVPSNQSGFLYKGEKECLDVTFQDGRKIRITDNHKLLTNTNEWIEVNKFVSKETRIKTGVTNPLVNIKEEINICSSWILKAGSLLFKITDNDSYFKALSFVRIIGYLCADATIYYDTTREIYKGAINLGHMIDVNNIIEDLEKFCVINQSNYKCKNYYSIRIPTHLLCNIIQLKGITIGSKIKQAAKLPEFILDPNCPLPIVREFLGGLFGGDGHTCVLGMHRGKRDLLSSVSFSRSKNKVHLESLTQMMEDIKMLLARFDIHKVTIQNFKETSYSKSKKDSVNKSYQLTLHLEMDELIPFHDKIGFRYCCHKSQRLEAGVSYKRLRNEVTRQHNWIVQKVDELTHFSEIKKENPNKIVQTKQAIETAVKELQITEPLIHPYAIPSTHDITDHLIKGTKFGKFTSKAFPTAEEYLKEIGALDWFLNDEPNNKISENEFEYLEEEKEENITESSCYGVNRECEGLPTMDLKVIDIRPAGVHPVYDIEVENTHSFLANGIVAHNCMVSHGASRFTRGRMYDASDKYSVYVCKKCGLIASYNDKMHIHHCRTCDNRVDFAYVEIPYACKLLFQELNTMNIAPRLITDH